MKDGKVTIAEIGPRLKLIRQELGITQKQLAQDLDMNQAILSKFENGGMVYASVLLDVLCYFRDRINGYRRLIAVVQSGQFEVVGLELFHALGGFEEAHQVCDDALIDFSSYNE